MRLQQQNVFIFILLALQGKSHARQVKEVAVITNEKMLAMEGESNFNLQKEILPSARIGGKKMSFETRTKASKEQSRNSKKVSVASSSSAAIPSVGNRKSDEEENWKENFKAFTADYRSPKPHPPKNNR